MRSENIDIPIEYYPIVIRQSRYGGVYEGGRFFCYSEKFPLPETYFNYLDGDDDAALDFWHSDDSRKFGVGNFPDSALIDFIARHFVQQCQSSDDTHQYKQIVSAFENKITKTQQPEILERTDYFQCNQPIFLPRKNKEF